MNNWDDIERLSEFFIARFGKGKLGRLEQISQLTSEMGEVHDANCGVNGSNPRKGVTHTDEDVARELADVAGTALISMFFFSDNPRELFDQAVTKFITRLNAYGQDSTNAQR